MKKITICILIILLICNTHITRAQQNDTLEIQRDEQGSVKFARFSLNPNRMMKNDLQFLQSVLQGKKEDSFILTSEISNESGGTHRKYQQYYRGLKVENAEYLVHGRNGVIETINGNYESIKILSITPALNEQLALRNALDFVNSKAYKWEDESYEKFIKQKTNNPDTSYYPVGELLIINASSKGGKNYKLAWKFRISSLSPDNEQCIYIDAISGAVVGNKPLIYDTNTTATAQTRYNSSNVSITTDSYSNGFRLSETRATTQGNSVNIHTWNCQNGSSYPNSVEFSNTNTNWVTGSWPSINQDQASLDAHWGAEIISDYWSTIRRRNSINNQGLNIIGYVHYNDVSRPNIWPNNAQWDGANNVMRYGDGDGVIFNPLVSLDVVAHEIGHGITQYTAGLGSIYGISECDALNEGFSDIWSACVEHWAAPNKQTWLMDDEIFASSIFSCIRDLQNPHSTTAAEGQHPNTYHGSFWDATGEPHFNSTVLSHWFYLLSEGGTGWNNGATSHAAPNDGYSWTVIGIGIEDAARLAYITEAYYANSSSTYNSIRTNSIAAAVDSFGVNSCQVINVTNAWYAVGVGGQFQYTNVNVSGPSIVCSSGSLFTITNLPPGITDSQVTWSCSNNLQPQGGVSGTSKTFYPLGSGSAWIEVAMNTGCGSITLPRIQVTTDYTFPSGRYIEIEQGATWQTLYSSNYISNDEATVEIWLPGVSSFQWSLNYSDGTTYWGTLYSGATMYFNMATSTQAYFQVTYNKGSCGVMSNNYSFTKMEDYYSAYPNPVSDILNIEIDTKAYNRSTGKESVSSETIFDILLYNGQGNLLRNTTTGGEKATLNVSDLLNGIYYLHLRDGKNSKPLVKQIIVQH